ncbi:17522_t:CDS:2, partial [Acaulospora colombiana]
MERPRSKHDYGTGQTYPAFLKASLMGLSPRKFAPCLFPSSAMSYPVAPDADELSGFVLINAEKTSISTAAHVDHDSLPTAVDPDPTSASSALKADEAFSFAMIEVEQTSAPAKAPISGTSIPTANDESEDEYKRSVLDVTEDEWE